MEGSKMEAYHDQVCIWEDASGFGSKNVGKKSQLETGSPVRSMLQ